MSFAATLPASADDVHPLYPKLFGTKAVAWDSATPPNATGWIWAPINSQIGGDIIGSGESGRLDTLEATVVNLSAKTDATVNEISNNGTITNSLHLNVIEVINTDKTITVDILDGTYVKCVQSGNGKVTLLTPSGRTIEGSADGLNHNRDRTEFKIFRKGNEHTISHVHDEGIAAVQANYPEPPTPPATPEVTFQATQDRTPLIVGTSEAGTTLSIEVNGLTYTAGADLTVNGDGSWSLQIPSDLPDGIYRVKVTSTNETTGLSSVSGSEEDLEIQSATITMRGLLPEQTLEPLFVSSEGPTINGYNSKGTFEFRLGNTSGGALVATMLVELKNFATIHPEGTASFSGHAGSGVVAPAPNGLFSRVDRILSLKDTPSSGSISAGDMLYEFDFCVTSTDETAPLYFDGLPPGKERKFTIGDFDNGSEISNLSRPWNSISGDPGTPPTEISPGTYKGVQDGNAAVEWVKQPLGEAYEFHWAQSSPDQTSVFATVLYREPVRATVQNDGSNTILSAVGATGNVSDLSTVELA